MRIGVNARLLLKGRLEGIGYFAQQLVSRMAKSHPEDEFILFFDRKYSPEFVFADNVKPVVVPLQSRHPVLWKIYFDNLLPLYCRKYKIDVFFSPENHIPSLRRTPVICTVHDINFMHDTTFIGNSMHNRYFLKYFPLNAGKCSHIITVSNYSKEDIARTWNIPEEKISVVYNAANPIYGNIPEEEKNKAKERYSEAKEYFYFVGAIHKRKNLARMFQAFDVFKRESRSDCKFIVIGNRKWWHGEIEDAYNAMEYKNDVVFTGRLEAEDVARIASASLGLVFPSLFEGFGIPIVEAFAAECPVITSTVTSLPEVAGDAALTVNPLSVKEIASAMLRLYSDKALREELIRKGKERNRLFSWDKSADNLWKTIQQCYQQIKQY